MDAKIAKNLVELKQSLKQNATLGPLVNLAKTLDQAQALLQLFDGLVEKNVRHTISMTAGRGRVKYIIQYLLIFCIG